VTLSRHGLDHLSIAINPEHPLADASVARTRRAASRAPYLILLQAGFTMQPASRLSPVVSYTTFSPLPLDKLGAVYSLWHFPSLVLKHETSQHYAGTPYPAESGLSSLLRPGDEGKPSAG